MKEKILEVMKDKHVSENTMKQIGMRAGCSITHASHLVAILMAEGKVKKHEMKFGNANAYSIVAPTNEVGQA
jgi:hypothetical protein